MFRPRHRFGRVASAAVLLLSVIAIEGACSAPTRPSDVIVPPGDAATPVGAGASLPPTITCPESAVIPATQAGGAPLTFDLPFAQGGDGAVGVTCLPEPGSLFPLGSTPVICTAQDARSRTASCTFTVTVTDPPRLRLSRFLAFGDSMTVGEVVVPGTEDVLLRPITESYPAVLSEMLKRRYVGQTPTVFNGGVSGEHAELGPSRFGGVFRAAGAEAVIILEGANDLLYADPSIGVQNVERGVSMLAADARNRGARVFIATLPPTRPGRRHVPLGVVVAANDRLRVVARGEGAYVIDVFGALLPDVNATIGSDGLHPTELGYRRIAETVFAALRADLEVR